MKKTLSKFLALSLVVSLLALPISADDEQTSTGKITFDAADTGPGVVDPVDPTDPIDPGEVGPTEPEDGGPTGSTGNLRIDSTPWFDFGSAKVGQDHKGLQAKTGNKWSESIQLSDLRFEDGAEWTLLASLGEFKPYLKDTATPATAQALSGTIKFAEPNLYSQYNPTNVDVNAIAIESSTTADKKVLAYGNDAPGRTVLDWFQRTDTTPTFTDATNSNITLDIDARNAKVNLDYIAEITWTLSSGNIAGN